MGFRKCDHCKTEYEYIRLRNPGYCGPACRMRASVLRNNGQPTRPSTLTEDTRRASPGAQGLLSRVWAKMRPGRRT